MGTVMVRGEDPDPGHRFALEIERGRRSPERGQERLGRSFVKRREAVRFSRVSTGAAGGEVGSSMW